MTDPRCGAELAQRVKNKNRSQEIFTVYFKITPIFFAFFFRTAPCCTLAFTGQADTSGRRVKLVTQKNSGVLDWICRRAGKMALRNRFGFWLQYSIPMPKIGLERLCSHGSRAF